jgi:hypothetical protein
MTTIKELANEMKALTPYEQGWIIDRFVAQQKNAALVREMQRQAEARTAFVLQQLRYDMEFARKINAES